MAELVFTHTSRGFAVARFRDHYESECSLQKSSIVSDEECIWLGVDRSFDGERGSCRMHLTQEMVRAMLPALQHFVDHGELPVDGHETEAIET